MSFFEKLNGEIAEKIAGLRNSGQPLVGSWIAHDICNDHLSGLAKNEEADFWRHGGYRTVRDEVRRHVSKHFKDDAVKTEAQATLPGFQHLRTDYMIERDGDEQVVSVFELTDTEIDGKANLYRSMGAACFAHADELERFKAWRVENVLVAAE